MEQYDLVAMPRELRVTTVRQILSQPQGGKAAEDALMALAEDKNGGTEALAEVVASLTPFECGRIVGDRAGLASGLCYSLSPIAIAEMLEWDPIQWKEAVSKGDIFALQDQAVTLLTTIIVMEDDGERLLDIVQAIRENPGAWFYLGLPFMGAVERDGTIRYADTAAIHECIQEVNPTLARELIALAAGRTMENGEWEDLARRIRELRIEFIEASQPTGSDVEDDMFKPL